MLCVHCADEVWQFLGTENDVVLELVSLVSPTPSPLSSGGLTSPAADSSTAIVAAIPDSLRALAVRVLAVMLQDRARHQSVINAINGSIGQGGPGLLANLMHTAITAYVASGQSGAQAGEAQQPPAEITAAGLSAKTGLLTPLEQQAVASPASEAYLQVRL